MKKELSIITINLNNASGLEKTINSVLNQSFKNYEYIIIDGKSTDQSVSVIKKYSKNISFWISEVDRGIYHAMNKGINIATGNYTLFLNSGDYLFEDSILEKIFSISFSEDIVYGNQLRFGSNGSYLKKYPKDLTFMQFYAECMGHNSTLIKRSLYELVGLYNEENKIVSDWEFLMLAICKHNCSTKYMPFPIATQVDGGISNNPDFKEKVIAERINALKKHFPMFLDDYSKLYKQQYNSFLKKLKRSIINLVRL